MQAGPLRIVQISDTHLYANPKQTLLGVNTQESFQALLSLLKAENIIPNLFLLTGDLSQDASEAAYIRIAEQLSEFNIPIYCLPGNHDDLKVMSRIYPHALCSMQKQLIFSEWQIILLDSHVHGKVIGHLSNAELDYMKHCIEMFPKHKAIIVFHHQPVAVGSKWLDNIGLTNADEFWEAVKHFPQVHTVLFGHVHQSHEGKKDSIPCYSPPSTCIQFKTNSANFALEKLPPGCRIIDLYPNGELKTEVRRVASYVGTFDPNAKGY